MCLTINGTGRTLFDQHLVALPSNNVKLVGLPASQPRGIS